MGDAEVQVTSNHSNSGAGGDRTHDRRIMSSTYLFSGFPTCANVPGIASALPQSARDARLPLAPSFAGYGEAPSECSTGADVRGAENLTTERGDSADAQQLVAKVGHQAQPAAKC